MSKIVQLPVSPQPNQPKERRKKRADGLYQVELRYTDESGASKKKSFYGKTQAEANAKRKSFEREMEQGIRVAESGKTVKKWAEEWLETYKSGLRSKTYESYAFDVKLLTESCGHKLLKTVTLSDVQAIVNGRAGLSFSAVKKTTMTLKAVFEAARMDRLILFNPCDKLIMPAAKSGTHKLIDEPTRKLIATAAMDHRMHVAAALMLYAGLRKGEAMAFNVQRDVDFDKQEIHVKEAIHFDGNTPFVGPPKTASGVRTIPILPPLDTILEAHNDMGLVLTDAKGKLMSKTAFQKCWVSYLYHLEVALNGVRPRWASDEQKQNWKSLEIQCHDLRHTFCTMLYDADVDVKTAQEWMGHADPSVTMRIYTHLSSQKRAAAVKAAMQHFSKSVGNNVGKIYKKRYCVPKNS